MSERGGLPEACLESEDRPCERCGHPTPRLYFDASSQLLLCQGCREELRAMLPHPLRGLSVPMQSETK